MDLVAATDELYHLSEVQLRNGNSGAQSPNEVVLLNPPPLAAVNLSCREIGDYGVP